MFGTLKVAGLWLIPCFLLGSNNEEMDMLRDAKISRYTQVDRHKYYNKIDYSIATPRDCSLDVGVPHQTSKSQSLRWLSQGKACRKMRSPRKHRPFLTNSVISEALVALHLRLPLLHIGRSLVAFPCSNVCKLETFLFCTVWLLRLWVRGFSAYTHTSTFLFLQDRRNPSGWIETCCKYVPILKVTGYPSTCKVNHKALVKASSRPCSAMFSGHEKL